LGFSGFFWFLIGAEMEMGTTSLEEKEHTTHSSTDWMNGWREGEEESANPTHKSAPPSYTPLPPIRVSAHFNPPEVSAHRAAHSSLFPAPLACRACFKCLLSELPTQLLTSPSAQNKRADHIRRPVSPVRFDNNMKLALCLVAALCVLSLLAAAEATVLANEPLHGDTHGIYVQRSLTHEELIISPPPPH
jgi:hypothetical protein